MMIRPDITKDKISEILVKWSMPTRQMAINEIRNLLNEQIPKIEMFILQSLVSEMEKIPSVDLKVIAGNEDFNFGIRTASKMMKNKIVALIKSKMENK